MVLGRLGFVFRSFAEFGGKGDFIDVFAQEALYLAELGLVIKADKGDGTAFGAGAGGTADAMHIVFRVVGDVKVDDKVYVINVNTT